MVGNAGLQRDVGNCGAYGKQQITELDGLGNNGLSNLNCMCNMFYTKCLTSNLKFLEENLK